MRLDEPVDNEVGVAANRGGEMGVEVKGEAEVPDVARRVNGLAHRTKGRGLHEIFLRFTFYCFKKLVQFCTCHLAIVGSF